MIDETISYSDIARRISERSHRSETGNAYIEYLVIALAVFVAVIAFFSKGDFMGAKPKVEAAFDSLVDQVVKP